MRSMPPWQDPDFRFHRGPWRAGFAHKRRFLVRRFVFAFMGLLLPFVLTLALLGLIFEPLRQALPGLGWLALAACGVPLGFLLLMGLLGTLFFRRVGGPLAEVMAAADAVAEGDLSVRVRENAPGELGRLARSFNRMAAGLERAEQQRRSLTADVAHELRTPLHILQGNLEGILDGIYQPDTEQISAALDETRLLARLVDDLQTLSLAEAGQLPLHRVPVAAADLVEDVVTSFSGQAAQAGVELRADLPADPAGLPQLQADPDRLDQVLSNLVANALRYTPAGGRITVSARAVPGGVRLAVTDTGAGIPPEDLPYLFERFWRGDRARTRQPGTGSGLGLAISRRLVEAHGGTLQAFSPGPGQGSQFVADLPS